MMGVSDDCLGDDTIAEFLGGRREGSRYAKIEQHLDQCPSCRQHVSDLVRGSSSSSTPLTSAPRALAGRYQVLSALGRGGNGDVFLAYDLELGRRVAVKLLRPDRFSVIEQLRLRREAQAMAQLAHPNVVSVYDLGIEEGQAFITMELVEGSTLAAWSRQPKRTTSQRLDVCLQAGRGLAAAHALGLVHRDLTPNNILVSGDGRARVSDFGLALLAEPMAQKAPEHQPWRASPSPPSGVTPHSSSVTSAWTMTGEFLGTPSYAAPELFAGGRADALSDQWSFAATTYDCLCGRPPFEGNSIADLARAIGNREFSDPSRLSTVAPRRVVSVLLRALSVNAADRFRSMNELLEALEQAKAPRGRRWAIAAALVMVVGAGTGGRGLSNLQQSRRCLEAGREIETVWGAEARGRMREAWIRSGRPPEAQHFARLLATLDTYAETWSSMRADSCEASSLRQTQSSSVHALRERCFRAARTELSALIEGLSSELGDSALHFIPGTEAALNLPRIADCGDLVALAIQPSDDAAGGALQSIQHKLASARVNRHLGRYSQELSDAKAAVEEAAQLGHQRLWAQALYEQAFGESDTGEVIKARATIADAARRAALAHDDVLVARCWILLLYLLVEESLDSQAAQVEPLVATAVARAGRPHLDYRFLSTRAILRNHLGQNQEALSDFEESVALAERALGPEDIEVGKALANQANYFYGLRQFQQGDRASERAGRIFEKHWGNDHPVRAQLLLNQGHAAADQGDWELSTRLLEDALQIQESALGVSDVRVAWTLRTQAHQLMNRLKTTEALPVLERARAIFENSYGPENPHTVAIIADIAEALARQGPCDVALRSLEAARQLNRRVRGEEGRKELSSMLGAMARCLAMVGQKGEAMVIANQVLEDLGDERSASAGFIQYDLAQAMKLAGRSQAAARALGLKARANLTESGPGYVAAVAAVDAWLETLGAHR